MAVATALAAERRITSVFCVQNAICSVSAKKLSMRRLVDALGGLRVWTREKPNDTTATAAADPSRHRPVRA